MVDSRVGGTINAHDDDDPQSLPYNDVSYTSMFVVLNSLWFYSILFIDLAYATSVF